MVGRLKEAYDASGAVEKNVRVSSFVDVDFNQDFYLCIFLFLFLIPSGFARSTPTGCSLPVGAR